MTEVTKTIRLAVVVDTLSEAWSFVMAHMNDVGARPGVSIQPLTELDLNPDQEAVERYEVVVEGTVEYEEQL